MAALVADGIARYAVNQAYNGRAVVNIFDMKIDTTGTITDREEACFAQAGNLMNAWVDIIVPLLADQLVTNSVAWVDLDSLTGSVGARTSTTTTTLPAPGGTSSAKMPGNVAIRVNKQTSGGRGTRQGRLYLCGVNEASTDPNNPNSPNAGWIAQLQPALDDFLDAIRGENDVFLGNAAYTSQLHVIHTTSEFISKNVYGPPEFVSSSPVTALTVDPILGSQRRRLRG